MQYLQKFLSESSKGFSQIETLVVLTLLSILSAVAVYDYTHLQRDLNTATAQLEAYLNRARAKGISSTEAYFISPISNSTLVAEHGFHCSSTDRTADPELTFELPEGIEFVSTSWTVCFTSRGLSDSNVMIEMMDPDEEVETVEVLLGGGLESNV